MRPDGSLVGLTDPASLLIYDPQVAHIKQRLAPANPKGGFCLASCPRRGVGPCRQRRRASWFLAAPHPCQMKQMKLGVVTSVVVLFAVLSCGHEERDFGMGGGASFTDHGGENNAGSDNPITPSAGADGSGGVGPSPGGADAGAAGSADMEPADLCVGKVCDAPPAEDCLSGTEFHTYDKIGSCDAGTCSYAPHVISCTCVDGACTTDPCLGLTCAMPPASICKNSSTLTNYAESGTCSEGSCSYEPADTDCEFGCANGACKADPCANLTCNTPPGSTCKDAGTRTTYAANGTCTSGTCSYAPTDTPCTGATPKCKNLGTSSKCVACLGNNDCSNGATCSAAGACVCSNRFNGPHCEFQVFRGFGVLANDTQSQVNGISHDGTVVVGNSSGGVNPSLKNAVRSVNGAPLQFIPELSSETPSAGCDAQAVDASGRVFGTCEYGDPFQYTPATMSVPIDVSPYTFAPLADVSSDGTVVVGYLANPDFQPYRRTSQGVTALGLLEPGGQTHARAVSGDGAVVVGWDSDGNNDSGWIWRSSTGVARLAKLPSWTGCDAWDVSTDGKVIVGFASDGNCVKWTGTTFSPSIVGPGACNGTNQDGSVIVGENVAGDTAMVWNGAAHKVTDLLGATPDLAGWTLIRAEAVSDDGKFVVGNGTNTANGAHAEGWIAHLP